MPEVFEVFRSQAENSNNIWDDAKKMALAKRDSGEKLSPSEERALSFEPRPLPTYEAQIRSRQPRELVQMFGTDVDLYRQYYDENRYYFWPNTASTFIVDEDVKSLGIPNNDKRMLDAAIKLLESGKDTEKGRRILSRYTLVDFATAKEWRNWYNRYEDKIFFTEKGGWLFLINSYEPGLNDYYAAAKWKTDSRRGGHSQSSETDDRNPVKISTGVNSLENGNREFFVRFRIHPGHYIFANVANSDPYIATEIEIEIPEGFEAVGELKKPAFRPYNQNGTTIYEGDIVFSREMRGSGVATVGGSMGITRVEGSIMWQSCDGNICLAPQTVKFHIQTPLE
jgi:hypothetical protein